MLLLQEIELEEPFENIGQLVKEVAVKTQDVAGDGTTSATLLAQAIIREGLKNVTAGANPMSIKRGIEKATNAVVEEIKAQARPVETRDAISQVAAISADDREIGELIAEAMEKVGKDGVITTEESKGFYTELKVVEGMMFDRGYISHYMVSDTEKMEAVLDEPYVLATNRKSATCRKFCPFRKVVQSASPYCSWLKMSNGKASATIILNKLRGTFNCVAVKAPLR